jgi:hypothetical protein
MAGMPVPQTLELDGLEEKVNHDSGEPVAPLLSARKRTQLARWRVESWKDLSGAGGPRGGFARCDPDRTAGSRLSAIDSPGASCGVGMTVVTAAARKTGETEQACQTDPAVIAGAIIARPHAGVPGGG